MTTDNGSPELRRSLGLARLAFYGIGTILGAGIYALIGKVVGASGQLAPLAFLVSAVLALFTAYAYCQLVARFPKSGGEAEYIYHGFRSRGFSNLVGWLVALTGVVSAATLVDGFIGYFQVFFSVSDQVVAAGLIVAVTAVAIVGISESAWTAVAITLVEIVGLVIVCSAGFGNLVEKDFMMPEMTAALDISAVAPVLAGAFLAFYAFIGFEDMVNLAEETREPGTTIPGAIYIALAVATALYLMVALVALASLPVDRLQQSDAPLADMYSAQGGDARLISVIGLIAIINGVLAQIIMASRILYGMRHRPGIFRVLSRIYARTRTPVIATLFVSLVVLGLTVAFPIETLARATSFIILIVFSLVNLALILTERQQEEPKIVNLLVPAIAIALNLAFLVFEVS